jgi:histidyl-tRNA synthetase
MSDKFQPPRGTRDFLPEEMILREKVFDTVKKVFRRYGYDPAKTPAFENFELFAMKESIGEGEQDKLYIFQDKSERKLALRFDQTVPLARLVATNPQLPKPFKRYEISRVWRYEDTRRGRYREFWQCDVDIVGSEEMSADAEIIDCAMTIMKELGFEDCYVRINNRKLLSGITRFAGVEEDKIIDVFRAIDKLDKIGIEGVRKELEDRGIANQTSEKIIEIIGIEGEPKQVLSKVKDYFGDIKEGLEGVQELQELVNDLEMLGRSDIVLDISLARGLDYYTSTIFELMGKDENIGSLAGGGRYDKMIGAFTGDKKEISATGIALGIERIIDLLKEKEGIFQKTYTKVFVINVNDQVRKKSFEIAQKLRESGINTQVDIMGRPLSKQLDYANSLGIPYTIIVGPKEVESNKFNLKNMKTGEETELSLEKITKTLS